MNRKKKQTLVGKKKKKKIAAVKLQKVFRVIHPGEVVREGILEEGSFGDGS